MPLHPSPPVLFFFFLYLFLGSTVSEIDIRVLSVLFTAITLVPKPSASPKLFINKDVLNEDEMMLTIMKLFFSFWVR